MKPEVMKEQVPTGSQVPKPKGKYYILMIFILSLLAAAIIGSIIIL
jgi:hypothetical protein